MRVTVRLKIFKMTVVLIYHIKLENVSENILDTTEVRWPQF